MITSSQTTFPITHCPDSSALISFTCVLSPCFTHTINTWFSHSLSAKSCFTVTTFLSVIYPCLSLVLLTLDCFTVSWSFLCLAWLGLFIGLWLLLPALTPACYTDVLCDSSIDLSAVVDPACTTILNKAANGSYWVWCFVTKSKQSKSHSLKHFSSFFVQCSSQW